MKARVFSLGLFGILCLTLSSQAFARSESQGYGCYLKAGLRAPQFEDDRNQDGALTELIDIAIGSDDYGTKVINSADGKFRASINGPNLSNKGKAILDLSLSLQVAGSDVMSVATYNEQAPVSEVVELPLVLNRKSAYAKSLAKKCDPKGDFSELTEVTLVCGPKASLLGLHSSSYAAATDLCGQVRTAK